MCGFSESVSYIAYAWRLSGETLMKGKLKLSCKNKLMNFNLQRSTHAKVGRKLGLLGCQ